MPWWVWSNFYSFTAPPGDNQLFMGVTLKQSSAVSWKTALPLVSLFIKNFITKLNYNFHSWLCQIWRWDSTFDSGTVGEPANDRTARGAKGRTSQTGTTIFISSACLKELYILLIWCFQMNNFSWSILYWALFSYLRYQKMSGCSFEIDKLNITRTVLQTVLYFSAWFPAFSRVFSLKWE